MSRMRYLVLTGHVCALLVLSLFLPARGHALTGLANALDSPVQTDGVTPLVFSSISSTASGGLWSAVSTTVYDNTWGTATQSGATTGGESSSLTTTVTGPASISFYQKVSSQLTYDTLTFSFGGSTKSTISGTKNWQQKMFTLPTGTNTLEWKYAKNRTINGGSDAAWLDKVVVSPNTTLAVTYPNGGEILTAGSTTNITWNAPAAAERYDLYYTTNNGATWISIAKDRIIPNFTGITYSWLVPVPAGGNKTACKVKIIAKNTANAVVGTDVSNKPFTIEVLRVTAPNGGEIGSANTGTYPVGFVVSGLTSTTASATVSYTMDGGVTWPVIGKIQGSGAIIPGPYTIDWNPPAVTTVKSAKVKVVIKSKSGVVLAADTSDAKFTILPVFTVSGVATLNGKVLAGVTMTLGGDESATTVTDSLGKYAFRKLLKGSYSVKATKTGLAFNPAVTAVAVTTANIAAVNFSAIPSTDTGYALSGKVLAGGAPLPGVTMTLSGALGGTVVTNGDGYYYFGNLLPRAYYTVTPGKTGYTFGPLSFASPLLDVPWAPGSDADNVNFTASASAAATYSISGKATLNGAALSGVLVSVTGDAAAAGITDARGNYLIKGLMNGTYTITPSKFGCAFSSMTMPIAGANITHNFIATSAPAIRGTVAAGAPISGATVTVLDAHGASVTAVTAGNGTYSIETAGLTPPFLLLVTSGTGSSFYSVSADADAATTVNITPLTDLIIRSWYGAQGQSMDTAFADPNSYPAPPPASAAVLNTAVRNMMQLWLNQAGETANNFNLISTPFSAGGTGVDKVLDQASIDPGTGAVLVSDGTTTQTSTVSALSSSLTISTTTTNSDGTSSSNNATIVPVLTEEQAALDAISTLMGNFAHTVTIKGASLVASDLLPYLASPLLQNGFSRTQLANFFASYLVGRTLSCSVLRINSIDTTHGLADVVFQLAVSQGGQTSFMAYDFSFKGLNGSWLIYGNDRLAEVQVRALMNTNQGPFGTGSAPVIEADVIAPQGIVAGAVISGGTWTTATALTLQGVSMESGMNMEGYQAMDDSGQTVPAGTPFTVLVTPVSGPTATCTETLNTFTNEPVSILPMGTGIANANLGSALTVNWTLPKTYAVAEVWMDYAVFTGPQNDFSTKTCKFPGPTLGAASTTAQITFPTQCESLPVKMTIISLQAIGVNGENNMVHYQFGDGLGL